MDDKSERGRAEARRSFREEALDCVNLEKLFRVVVRHLFDLFTEEQGHSTNAATPSSQPVRSTAQTGDVRPIATADEREVPAQAGPLAQGAVEETDFVEEPAEDDGANPRPVQAANGRTALVENRVQVFRNEENSADDVPAQLWRDVVAVVKRVAEYLYGKYKEQLSDLAANLMRGGTVLSFAVFKRLARGMGLDRSFTWSKLIVLLVFGYVCVRHHSRVSDAVRTIARFIKQFFLDYVWQWFRDAGGWVSLGYLGQRYTSGGAGNKNIQEGLQTH